MTINIDKLLQITEEDRQSRAGIREEVIKDIINSLESNPIKRIYEQTFKTILEWLNTEAEFTSKEIRKVQLKNISTKDIAIELFIAVLMEQTSITIQQVSSKLANQLPYDDEWSGIQTAAEIIGACNDTGLYDVILPGGSGESIMIKPRIQLNKETIDFINRTQYLNPMVCEPDKWVNNRTGGYLTVCQHVVLGKENSHNQPQALDAINLAQSVEWELDEYILEHVEEPNKKLETREQREAHNKLAGDSDYVYREMLTNGNHFNFVYQYDFRGRMYSHGYYVNLQSTSYKKALLNFKEKELIT